MRGGQGRRLQRRRLRAAGGLPSTRPLPRSARFRATHTCPLSAQANVKEPRFGVDFFRRFDCVLNGLDNLEVGLGAGGGGWELGAEGCRCVERWPRQGMPGLLPQGTPLAAA